MVVAAAAAPIAGMGAGAPAASSAAGARSSLCPPLVFGGCKSNPPPPSQSPPPGPSTRPRRSDEILSNEVTYTRWAYVSRTARIYRRPTTKSRRVGRLRRYIPYDHYPEVYLLLRAHWDANGREWIKLRIPARPDGQVGWVKRGALSAFHVSHQRVVVNRERLRLYFYSFGHLIWSAPVGVGKPSTPTPPGRFWIRDKFTITDPSSGYYPYAFGTADYSNTETEWPGGGVVGIHGPYYEPQGIPGRISHGCIRLQVKDDRWLGHRLKVGTPVRVV